MSSDLNRVTMIARLVRDPEQKYTQSGTAVCHISVANGYTYKQGGEKKEAVSFFDCVIWGALSEVMVKYGEKGKQIALEGWLNQERWNDADGKARSRVEIKIENFQFLGSKSDSTTPDSGKPSGLGKEVNLSDEDNPFSENDIPF